MHNTITQLILDGLPMPEVSYDKYVAWEEELNVDLVMADRSMVRQVPDKNKVYRANYTYDVLDTETRNKALATLQGGKPFRASVLLPQSGELVTSDFYCVSLTPPSFAFNDNGEAVWHNMAFSLREVTPHA